jgi:hypothetical protein
MPFDQGVLGEAMSVMNTRARYLTLPVVAAASLLMPLLPTAAQAAAGDPTVSITAPADGSTVWGRVPVAVSGATDPLGTDTPAQLQLFVDGAATPAQTFNCPVTATPNACDTTFTWDATGLSGAHVLTAAIVTTGAVTIISSAVNVTVNNPAPTVSITSPTSGDTVFGSVSVAVTGAVDTTLTDAPSKLLLSVDGGTPQSVNCPAPGPTNSCTHSFTWDATGLTGSHSLTATIDTNNAVQAVSTPVNVTVKNPAPVVAITSPANSGTVIGLTTVSVTGSTDSTLSDYPAALELLVDGVSLQTKACPTPLTVHSCSLDFAWDATTLSGAHVLTAIVHTTNVLSGTSPAVNVTVSNPAPSVQIMSPTTGDTVSGVKSVSIEGVTDAALTDYPAHISLSVDGVPLQTLSCPLPQTAHTCTLAFSWDSTGLSGSHTLSASMTTVNALTVNASDVVVTVNSFAPRIAITSPADGSTVTGTVDVSVSGVTPLSQTDYPQQLSYFVDGVEVQRYVCPSPSSAHTCSFNFQWDTTGLSGDHILSARELTTRGLTATSTPVTVTASNPLPTASVTSPSPGATVSGITTVTVIGSTDASQSDYPASLALYVDGTLFQTAPCPLPHTTHSCQSSFTWDSTGLSGTHVLSASVSTTRGLTATSAGDSITVNSPAPTATVTSPTDGSTVADLVRVSFTGSTDASQTDFPASLALAIDGTPFTSFPCPLPHTVHSCSGSVNWDTAGLSGTHVLTASVVTTKGVAASSVDVSITVNNPGPTAAVLSPTDGSSVAGVTTVNVSGTTDASQSDYPSQIALYVDGNSFQSFNCPTPQTVHSCSFAFTWDATGIAGTHVLSAGVVTTRANTGTSQNVTVTVDNPAPTATVTSPTEASTVSGTTSIAVTGSTGAVLSDYPAQLVLLIDGTTFQTFNCPTPLNVHTCGASFTWDATGVSGAHTLAVSITTTRSVTVTGPAVSINVNSPAPTVAITSPASGAQVSGTVLIPVIGTTDTSQSDKPSLLQMYIDGHLYQDSRCPTTPSAKTCSATFRWDSSGKLGSHSLRARMYSAKNIAVVSKPVSITVTRVQAVVSVFPPATSIAGKPSLLKGCVRASSTGLPATKIQVVITVTPSYGKPIVLKTVSGSNGCYTVSYKAVANAVVTAKTVATAKYAASISTKAQVVAVAVACKVSAPKVTVGVKITTTCTLAALKPGLPVEMQFNQGGDWHNVLVVSTGGTKRTFTVALGSPGTYLVRVVLPKSRYFALSESKPIKFVVA